MMMMHWDPCCSQAILRPVSMMVPDFTLIAEIMMFR
jgi:hypothetical protein